MKKASATHRSLGKTGGASAGLESGVAEVAKVGKTEPETCKSDRPKPQSHGSVATK